MRWSIHLRPTPGTLRIQPLPYCPDRVPFFDGRKSASTGKRTKCPKISFQHLRRHLWPLGPEAKRPHEMSVSLESRQNWWERWDVISVTLFCQHTIKDCCLIVGFVLLIPRTSRSACNGSLLVRSEDECSVSLDLGLDQFLGAIRLCWI